MAILKTENLSYVYSGGTPFEKMAVNNVNIEIEKGEFVGVIGHTGSGKSTVVKLLLRFYDVNKGAIYINGKDIRCIEKSQLYSMFAAVLQQDFLYADTVEENIKFGRDISFDYVKEAAKTAQADSFITELTDNYQYRLSPYGTNISGGQRQRTLIARALANNPEILILDDSSSALDYKTEETLRKALSDKMKQTTVVTVAQRVSSVKDSDTILVLDEGKIIGIGTHEQLLESCPEYREISDSQMGGAFVD